MPTMCFFLVINFDFQVFIFLDPPLQSHITLACEDLE